MRSFFTLLFSFLSLVIVAQNINSDIEQIKPQLTEWRRHFHQHPELSNREFKTAAFIASYLKGLGLEVRTGVAHTGVVAILRGGRPGKVVALRADIDALPVFERTAVPFRSIDSADYMGERVAVMHACGHDSHIAILLATATVLNKEKNSVPGTVVFIFQPAEEGAPADEEGGAPLMIKEGVMDNPKVDAIFGLHINSATEIGKIKYTSGAAMSASDWFTVKVNGRSSHGSQPWLGIDPVTIAAQIVQGFQTIVSRQEDLTQAPVVITVGKISGGVRSNIIPEQVIMVGTIRTLDKKMQQEVHERIKRTAMKIAEASGAIAEVSITSKTEITYNDPGLVKKMIPSLLHATGNDNLIESRWMTQSEDFSYFGDKAPAFYFFLGGMPKGNDPTKAPAHHTSDFYIDDSMLDVGVKAFCNIVFDFSR